MNEIELLSLVKQIAGEKKKAMPYIYSNRKLGNEKESIPNYYPGYAQTVREYNRIRVHAEPGYFPTDLFQKASPNQEPKELQYQIDTYEQVTLDVFIDFVNTVGRIFHDSNWSIKYEPDDDVFIKMGESFQKYVEDGIGEWGSVENFVKHLLPALKLRDAEGVIAVRPEEMPTIEIEGEQVYDDSKLIEPKPYYFSCDKIVSYEYDDYYLLESERKSFVNTGTKNQKVGLVYEYYTKEGVYFIEQTGKVEAMTFTIVPFYIHNRNELFVYKLKGVPVYKGGLFFWQSPFLYAVSLLNSALIDESNLRVSKNMCVYPYRIQLGNICDFSYSDGNGQIQVCNNGQLWDSSLQNFHDCPSCKGIGAKSRISPMGVMLLKPKTTSDDGDSTFTGDPLKYVSPSTETVAFLRTEADSATRKARKILHLTDTSAEINRKVSDPTATGAVMDYRSMAAFIKPISDQIFELYEEILYAIGVQRYGDKFKRPQLSYPVTFDFETQSDFVNQLKDMMASGAPPFIIQAITMKFIKSLFYNERTSSLAFDLLVQTDRLLSMNQDDIAYGLSKGIIAPYEVILHDSGIFLVNQLYLDNERFFEQDFKVQQEQLIALAKEKAAEVKPLPPEQALIDNILGG